MSMQQELEIKPERATSIKRQLKEWKGFWSFSPMLPRFEHCFRWQPYPLLRDSLRTPPITSQSVDLPNCCYRLVLRQSRQRVHVVRDILLVLYVCKRDRPWLACTLWQTWYSGSVWEACNLLCLLYIVCMSDVILVLVAVAPQTTTIPRRCKCTTQRAQGSISIQLY